METRADSDPASPFLLSMTMVVVVVDDRAEGYDERNQSQKLSMGPDDCQVVQVDRAALHAHPPPPPALTELDRPGGLMADAGEREIGRESFKEFALIELTVHCKLDVFSVHQPLAFSHHVVMFKVQESALVEQTVHCEVDVRCPHLPPAFSHHVVRIKVHLPSRQAAARRTRPPGPSAADCCCLQGYLKSKEEQKGDISDSP
ncbi:hypothetical protein INR49_019330 [Caranx melampygus]|nr:hypothetical protein INR49_019330 [Caranx melampygus]